MSIPQKMGVQKCILLASPNTSVSLEINSKAEELRAFVLSAIIEESLGLSVTTESSLSTGRKMAYDNLKQKIRELGYLLAYEEEIEHRFANHYNRKREHSYLLKKLYQLEKR